MRVIDEIGKTYGIVDVLAVDFTPVNERSDKRPGTRFLCQCGCGQVVTMAGTRLRQKNLHNHCGCLMNHLPREEWRVTPADVELLESKGLLKRKLAPMQVYRNEEIPATINELQSVNLGRTQFFDVGAGETVTMSLIVNRLNESVRVVVITARDGVAHDVAAG